MRTCLLLIVLLGLFSCKKDEKRTEAEKIVKEWIGKEIKFPADYECNLLGKDTTLCTELLDARYKILLYIDSTGCTDCKLRLHDWKRLIQDADSLFTGNELSFLFFFYPKNKKELQFLFKRDQFNYPVFVDNVNQINVLNSFPDKQSYQCFLLDKDNKVVMIGNPTLNPKIWELYKEQVSGQSSNKNEKTTTVELDKTKHDFGDIKIGTKNQTVFTIKNTGIHPLGIQHIATSCGCTVVEWEKQPIKLGQTTDIKVEMNPEESGYFRKTINVYCNVEKSVIKLIISGNAN